MKIESTLISQARNNILIFFSIYTSTCTYFAIHAFMFLKTIWGIYSWIKIFQAFCYFPPKCLTIYALSNACYCISTMTILEQKSLDTSWLFPLDKFKERIICGLNITKNYIQSWGRWARISRKLEASPKEQRVNNGARSGGRSNGMVIPWLEK